MIKLVSGIIKSVFSLFLLLFKSLINWTVSTIEFIGDIMTAYTKQRRDYQLHKEIQETHNEFNEELV